MFRRVVAPVLRLLAFFAILLVPLFLAALARADSDSPPPHLVVTLRSVVLSENPNDRFPRGSRLPASAPAVLLSQKEGRFQVEFEDSSGTLHARGWAEASAFFPLDDPGETVEGLLERARLLVNQGDRPVLAAAYLQEAVRRDPARVDAWRLLGSVGERLAETNRPGAEGGTPASVTLASRWGIHLVPSADRKRYRYDGEAYRRLIALAPSAEMGEEARLRLLARCGFEIDPQHPGDLIAAAAREKDLGEFLASFPASSRRLPFLIERARLLAAIAEGAARKGDFDAAAAGREAAIEAASEVSSTAPASESARRRAADRLIARLTKSFPRRTGNERPVVSTTGLKAWFDVRNGRTVLLVTRANGQAAIQPYVVAGPDASTLAFDPTGSRLVWDEAPEPGRRRTRLLDLARARLIEPAAQAEPELLNATSGESDRYTTFLGFSPDGRSLLIVAEGFTSGGVRIPRRHYLCDAEGGRLPVLVERPFSSPNTIDWARLSTLERLAG